MAGEGTAEDALEGLAIVWPGYFSSPAKAPPMPPLGPSLECYAGTFASIRPGTRSASAPSRRLRAGWSSGRDAGRTDAYSPHRGQAPPSPSNE